MRDTVRDKVIRSVRFEKSAASLSAGGVTRAMVTTDDGAEFRLFSFYADELSFTEAELVGLTVAEARALHYRKDVEYLRGEKGR